jgi:hypothetical protein
VSSRGVRARACSSRPLPAAVLLLLAAVAVAFGPAFGGKSASPLTERFGSWSSSAAGASQPAAETSDASGKRAERDATPPSPLRARLRHSPAGANALERPTFAAVLAGVVVAGALVALAGGYAGSQRPGGRTLPRGSARSPPASLA